MSSKYSKEQLKDWAETALLSKEEAAFYYAQLIMTLCMFTGLSQEEVERKIQELADIGETA
jgi:hypothetical protein